MERGREDLPLPRRGGNREAAQGGEGRQGQEGQGQEMRRWLTIAAGAVARARRAAAARAIRICARGWPTQGEGAQGQARPAAADEAVRAVRVQRVRSARPVQAAQDRAARKAAASLRPTLARRKEPLESYPLESLNMVGTLEQGQGGVRAGAHAGEGRLSGSAGQLPRTELRRGHRRDRRRDPPRRNLVQDGAGDWTERSSTLQLIQADATRHRSEEDERVRLARQRIATRVRGPPRRVVARRRACAGSPQARRYAQSANSIDCDDGVERGHPGSTIVKFTLKNPPANPPAGFAIASPPRIALDFLDTGNGLGATQRAIDDAALCAAST